VIKHLKKSRHRAWMMPRTRLGWDSLSHLRAGWSVASGRLNLESDPRIAVATSGKSRAAPN
jgi:hypothetical protein